MAGRRHKVMVRHNVLEPPSLQPPRIDLDDGTVNVARIMARRTPKDILDLGLWVEQFLDTPTGELVCRTIHLLKAHAVFDSRQPAMNADRVLGQLQAYEAVLNAIEGYVKDRRETQAQIAAEDTEGQPQEEDV